MIHLCKRTSNWRIKGAQNIWANARQYPDTLEHKRDNKYECYVTMLCCRLVVISVSPATNTHVIVTMLRCVNYVRTCRRLKPFDRLRVRSVKHSRALPRRVRDFVSAPSSNCSDSLDFRFSGGRGKICFKVDRCLLGNRTPGTGGSCTPYDNYLRQWNPSRQDSLTAKVFRLKGICFGIPGRTVLPGQ